MTRYSLTEIIDRQGYVVLDGSMGTGLAEKGFELNTALWTAGALVTAPELVRQVHLDYLKGGADCGITDSYQATVPGFMAQGYGRQEAEDYIALSVRLMRETGEQWWQEEGKAQGRPHPVTAGAAGPYGAYLADGSEYTGAYEISEEELRAFHRERMEILWKAGADILAIETIPSRREGEIMAQEAEKIGAKAWVTFSCRNGERTNKGDLLGEAAAAVDKIRSVEAIGVNCTHPKYITQCIRQIREATGKPIIVYPNSGEEYDAKEKRWTGIRYGKTLGEYAPEWYREGARIIGGCCQTLSRQIRDIARSLKEMEV